MINRIILLTLILTNNIDKEILVMNQGAVK